MTKFVLHGGYTSTKNKLNAGFYKEISKYLRDGSSILLIYFSRKEDEADKLFEQDKSRILEQSEDKELKVLLATRDNFMEQLRNADAIYMRGGNTDKLLSALKQYPDFEKTIEGKIVAGSSAGAYVLAKYYHSASKGGIHEGLGLLPIRVVCHYNSDGFEKKDDPIALMKKYPDDLELVVLKDYEWRTLAP